MDGGAADRLLEQVSLPFPRFIPSLSPLHPLPFSPSSPPFLPPPLLPPFPPSSLPSIYPSSSPPSLLPPPTVKYVVFFKRLRGYEL